MRVLKVKVISWPWPKVIYIWKFGGMLAWWLGRRIPEQEVGGSILTRVTVLCPWARHIYLPKELVIPRKRWLCPSMTEKLFTGTLRITSTNIWKLKLAFLRNCWAILNQILYVSFQEHGNKNSIEILMVTWPRWPPFRYMVKFLYKSSIPEPEEWLNGYWVCSIRDCIPS